jgi:transporter family-2 protein
MGSTGAAASVAVFAGLAGAIQIAVQGRLGSRIGSLESFTVAVVVAGAVGLLVLLIARRSLDGVRAGFAGPKWMLLGGLMGALIVLGITFAGPRIGPVATTAFLIVGQFSLGALIDNTGWFGVERVSLGWPRLAGLALLAAGATLTLKR